MDDLDDLLARRDGTGDGLARSFGLDSFDEVTCNRQRNVGFQKRHAHFAEGGFDVLFRQSTLFGQPIEYTG